LRSLGNGQVGGLSGVIKQLADLGIISNGNDNTLSLGDGTQLDNALSNHLNDVKLLFSDSTNGLAVKMAGFVNKTIGDDGTLVAKQANLTKQSNDIDTQISDMERRIADDKQRLTDSFVAMETAQAKITQQMQFLSKIG